jgi:hypothetical protein
MSILKKLQRRRLSMGLLSILVLLAAMAPLGSAAMVTFSNPRSMYGNQANQVCGPFGAVCGAAEAVNSFSFLNNYYSGIYNSTSITTGAGANATQAVTEFGAGPGNGVGNGTGGSPVCGYYNRFGVGANQCGTNNGVNQNYIDTKNDWLNQYAPNTTTTASATNGTNGANLLSAFLGPQLQAHEDVEIFWYSLDANGNPTNVGHVISPTSITYDNANPGAGASISFQDPNFPTQTFTVNATINTKGYLSFTDPASGGGTVGITAAFAESPQQALIPEPGTLALLMAPLGIVFMLKRRRSAGRYCSTGSVR